MKVVEFGKRDWRQWWVGLRLACVNCGRVVELEMGDDERESWRPIKGFAQPEDRVTMICERCGAMLRLDREMVGKG